LVKRLRFSTAFAKSQHYSIFAKILQKFNICTKVLFKAKQKIMAFFGDEGIWGLREGIKYVWWEGVRMEGGT
jgi:hypothetical protein